MSLTVGQLAKRTGLTVRALHHYDSIGLLTPSARSDSGYRLYQRDDIARLHQIQALRRLGLSLADIGTFLSRPDVSVSQIVARQLAALERQIEQATALRGQLAQLQRQLEHGIEPGLADWLSTLELMNMYDNYFTKEELARLPYFHADGARRREWQTLIAQAAALMARRTPPGDEAALKLAQQWLAMSERDTGGDAGLALRLGAMLEREPSARQESGITPEIEAYVKQAAGAFRLALYARYLDPDELRQLRDSGIGDAPQWRQLVAAVQRQMDAGAAPSDPAVRALARQWLQLLQNMTGGNPATRDKLRLAHEKEPMLLTGTWMSDAMLDYMRQAMLPA